MVMTIKEVSEKYNISEDTLPFDKIDSFFKKYL